MNLLLGLLPGVACVGGMYLCMKMMSGNRTSTSANDDAPAASGVAGLREEVARLRSELRSHDQESS